MMVMHPNERRGDYGLYAEFLRELEPIIRELIAMIEALSGWTFEPIE